MKKSKKMHFSLNHLVDVRTITENGEDLILTATEEERTTLAKRFDLPAIRSLIVEGHLFQDDLIVFEGIIKSEQERICVVSLEPFCETTEEPFRLLFSDKAQTTPSDMDVDADIVLPIVRGKINLGEAMAEEFGVNLNPFPRQTDAPFEYRDASIDSSEEKQNPFSVLKNLTHTD